MDLQSFPIANLPPLRLRGGLRGRYLLIMVLLLGFLAYRQFFVKKTPAVSYQSAKVDVGTLIVSLSASGSVSAANSATITTSATGVVKKLYVKNGDTVKSGQPVAEIDLDELSKQKYQAAGASYQSSKNSLESARSSLFTLQSKLFAANQKLINDAVARNLAVDDPTYIQQNADWLAAESAYKNQSSAISQAQTGQNSAWLSYRQASPVVYSPISGQVTGLWLQVGSVISTSETKIGSITTQAKPTVNLNLTEIDVSKISMGDKATIVFDAFPDQTFTGKVVSIDQVGSINSGVTNYSIVILLDTDNRQILSNMSAQATVILDSKTDCLLVPVSAVTTQNGASTVQVLQNNKPQSVTVETGLSSDTEVEIISGLREGDTVITGITTASASPNSQTRSVFSSFGGGGGAVRINR